MQALVYRFAAARWLGARLVGRRVPGLAVGLSGLVLQEVPDPVPPGPGWHRVRVLRAGICGTDVATLRGRTGPELSPFVSFPAVLGHEVLGVVEDGSRAGERVVLDPFLGCRTRGLEPCPACAVGRAALCHRFADGGLAPGMLLGYCRDLPGGWAERLLAHDSQLHPVPPGLPDDAAVLAEPLAVALHPFVERPVAAGDRVLVLGAGAIGLLVLAALALTGARAETVVVARHGHQAEEARRLGAGTVLRSLAEVEPLAMARGWGGRRRGLFGVWGWTGGFDRVVDAVGSPATVSLALRLARPGGRVDLLGAAGRLPDVDLTPLWAHELEVHGFCGYGAEPAAGGRHTIALALDALARRPDLGLERLVTHRFPLAAYRAALEAAFDLRRSRAVKVVFAPS